MNTQVPFQYAILRFTNDVETGEFLNVGLALYSHPARYFRVKFLTRYERLTSAFPGTDGELYRSYVIHLQNEFDQLAETLNQDRLPLAGIEPVPQDIRPLLYQVLPSSDSVLRFSEPKVGVSDDLDGAFDHLYARLIERYTKRDEPASRTDDEVWFAFKQPLQEKKLLVRLQPLVVKTKRESFQFEHTWRNGQLNVLSPQSFDLVRPASIREKAHKMIGRATVLQESNEQPHLVLLVGTPHSVEKDVVHAYQDAKGMIEDQGSRLSVEIVEEENADEFAGRVEKEIQVHVN